jgi:hypothetical protein
MLTVDVSKTVNELGTRLDDLSRKYIPFAAAKALTGTALAIQEREIHEMRDVFDRPTPYTLSGTYVKPATKSHLQAQVALKDFAGKGIAAATYLAPQITGGTRRLKRFERALRAVGHLPDDYFIVPGSGAKLDAYGNIQPSQLVQILSYFKAFPEAGYRANMSDRRRARLARGSKRKGTLGYAYFVGRPGGRLPLGVWQRFGFARGSAIKPVLIFVRQAHYQPIFDFADVATTNAERTFTPLFASALAEAIATR